MDEFDLQLRDVVLFELPTFEASWAFRLRLRPRWAGWSHEDEPVWLFAAELGADPADLSLLLREAQDLLLELGLNAIPFVLDDRTYLLEPDPALETAKAA